MASTYSTNLAIELIGTNDQAGTWGNTTNTNLGTLIEQAISGYVTQAVSTGADTTITIPNGASGVARNMFIELTGTGGANTNLIVPSNKKLYFIYNNSTGAVTVKVSGQTGVSVPAGRKTVLACNGTDVVSAISYAAEFTTTSLSLTTISATSGVITTLQASDTSSTVLRSASGTITNLLATTATVSNLSATVLRSASGTITNLISTTITGTSGTIGNLNVTNVGAMSGSGTVTLYANGDVCLITAEDGIQVKDGDGSNPTVNLVTSAGTVVGQLIYSSGLYLQSLVNSAVLVLNGYSSGGVQRSLLSADPNGNMTLYYAGQVGLQVVNTGQIVYSSANDNPEIGLYQDDKSTRNALIQASTSGLNIVQEVHGAPIVLISENNAGTQKTIFHGDPDDNTSIYAAGSVAGTFNNVGMYVFSTANDNPEIQFYRADKVTRNAFILSGTSALSIVNEAHGTPINLIAEDNGGTQRTLISADPDTGVAINYGSASALATAAIATNGTGATVTDGGGTARPVGFNVFPISSVSSTTDLRVANSGFLFRATSAMTFDIDTTTDSAPDGSFWTIENAAGANCSITATGVALLWLDGTSGSTGGRTLASYGYVTIIKVANGHYRVVGTGLS